VTSNLAIYNSSGTELNDGEVEYDNNEGSSVLVGSISVIQVGQTTPVNSADGVGSIAAPFSCVSLSNQATTPQMTAASLRAVLASLGPSETATGSDFVFPSSTSISFTTSAPAGITVDTTTLAIYRFNGVAWSSADVSNQSVSVSSLGVITSSGMFTRSGTFQMFYNGQDSSAPITTFGLQGSSYSFSNTAFVSTYSYAVLSATDPVVNGFASQVQNTFYRLDPAVYSNTWWVYNSPVPLPFGAHVFQYYSLDYAGNAEPVNTSTFVVTAGTVFQASANFTLPGKLEVGYSTNGFQAEVQAGANDWTLLISSPDTTPLFLADNVGDVGVGNNITPISPLDIQGTGSSGDIALQLRSGNSTSTSSVQGTFCFNGSNYLCHALTTQHNSASDLGNRMDFYLWNPNVATGTIGNLDVLSLQAMTAIAGQGAVHVMPVGAPNWELEVSNGVCTGCGSVERIAAAAPSTRERKSDIRYLTEKDAAKAYKDVMALKHASFRYKRVLKDGSRVPDPTQPLREGLIYEDAPESIQGGAKSIVFDERVANLELALQENIRKLETLQQRLKELEQ